MPNHKQLNRLSLLACAVMLIACSSTTKRADGLDMYRLQTTSPAAGGRAAPIDNDSYYSQPGQYQPGAYTGCAQINDSPSCGGG